jgi:hypothetical protein
VQPLSTTRATATSARAAHDTHALDRVSLTCTSIAHNWLPVGGDDCLPFEWHMHRIKAWPHLLKRLDLMNAWLLTQQSHNALIHHHACRTLFCISWSSYRLWPDGICLGGVLHVTAGHPQASAGCIRACAGTCRL